MVGEIEAGGDLAMGALHKHAFDGADHGHDGEGAGGLCLNCGTARVGPHCHRCGQPGHIHRSLGAIGHEIIHGVAHFEGKFWRTLPLLAWRPGELTRRYVEGERARFVSPMAIFLFSIFAMFAVFSWTGFTPSSDLNTGGSVEQLEIARNGMVEERKEEAEKLARLSENDPRRPRIEERIVELDAVIERLPQAESKGGVNVNVKPRYSDWAPLNHGIEKWKKNPALMLYKLQASSYKFSWLLIPLSLPFMWLLFAWRREYKLYDHTVFVTYSIAFMSLLLITATLLGVAGVKSGVLVPGALLIAFVHLLRQLKQAYRLGWLGAWVRAVILCFFILLVALLFLFALLAMGASG